MILGNKKKLSFSVFETERLLVRELQLTDASAISALRSDAFVNQYIDRPKNRTEEEAVQFIVSITGSIQINQVFYWAVCFKDELTLIGALCLWNFSKERESAEVGYELVSALHRQGIIQEALQPIFKFAFETLQIKSLEAYVHQHNIASIKLLERNNFKRDINNRDAENANNLIYVLSSQ